MKIKQFNNKLRENIAEPMAPIVNDDNDETPKLLLI
jgi:hypothetical protein